MLLRLVLSSSLSPPSTTGMVPSLAARLCPRPTRRDAPFPPLGLPLLSSASDSPENTWLSTSSSLQVEAGEEHWERALWRSFCGSFASVSEQYLSSRTWTGHGTSD